VPFLSNEGSGSNFQFILGRLFLAIERNFSDRMLLATDNQKLSILTLSSFEGQRFEEGVALL